MSQWFELICLIFVVGILVYLAVGIYWVVARNEKTYNFLKEVGERKNESIEALLKSANPDNIDDISNLINRKWEIYNSLDYEKVLKCNKPFKLSSWLSDEEINVLLKNNV